MPVRSASSNARSGPMLPTIQPVDLTRALHQSGLGERQRGAAEGGYRHHVAPAAKWPRWL